MKRALSLILVLVICFGLCSCADSDSDERTKPSKEDLLEDSVELSARHLAYQSGENLAKIQAEYCDKIVLLSGFAIQILDNHVVIGDPNVPSYVVDVYLSEDVLCNLSQSYYLTVVGKLSSRIIEKQDPNDTSKIVSHYQIKNAEFIQDRYELDGTLSFYTETGSFEIDPYKGHWEFYPSDDSFHVGKLYFDEEEEPYLSQFQKDWRYYSYYKECKISTRIYYSVGNIIIHERFDDAKLIS